MTYKGFKSDKIRFYNFKQFSCMVIHRIQTLTHWLAHRSSCKNFLSALDKLGGGFKEIKKGREVYARQVFVLIHHLIR